MNTNRLTQKEPALIQGAITSTATAFLVLIGTLVPSTASAGDHRTEPSRERILSALRLMSSNYSEYLCAKEIIRKESNYNINAKNGSHYGLAQGRSPYLATATYTQQLAWFYRYTRARYGDACRALKHHNLKGYY